MTVLEFVALTLVGISGTAVVLVQEPVRQSMLVSMFGLFLTATFFVLQAPDVALSMLVVSSVVVPMLVLLAVARVREAPVRDDDEEDAA